MSRFERVQVSAKTTLLQEGDIARKVYVIEKGCLRVWFNRKEEDMPFQFFFEQSMVSSIESKLLV